MKRNILIGLAFGGAIIFLLDACSYNSRYRSAPEEILQTVLADDYLVTPEDAQALNGDPAYQFIDLRSPALYAREHIENAVNIPTQNLLDTDNKDLFRDKSRTFILYGENELAANGPWMLLRQLGYGNVKVLQGGYEYWSDWEADGDYLTETALYPYDSLFTLATLRTRMEEEALRAQPKVVDQAPAPKQEIVPKKKKVEAEEEEGC